MCLLDGGLEIVPDNEIVHEFNDLKMASDSLAPNMGNASMIIRTLIVDCDIGNLSSKSLDRPNVFNIFSEISASLSSMSAFLKWG